MSEVFQSADVEIFHVMLKFPPQEARYHVMYLHFPAVPPSFYRWPFRVLLVFRRFA